MALAQQETGTTYITAPAKPVPAVSPPPGYVPPASFIPPTTSTMVTPPLNMQPVQPPGSSPTPAPTVSGKPAAAPAQYTPGDYEAALNAAMKANPPPANNTATLPGSSVEFSPADYEKATQESLKGTPYETKPVGETTTPTVTQNPPGNTGGTPTYRGQNHETWLRSKVDELLNGTFTWNPETDEEYKQAARVIENQVAQAMVGRGGLYSSVTKQDTQSQLQSLVVSMRKQRYDEWLAERDNTMKLIEWAQAQDDRAYARWQAQQAATAESQQAALDNMIANYEMDKSQYLLAVEKWKSTRIITPEMSTVLGIPSGYRAYQPGLLASAEDKLSKQYAAIVKATRESQYANAKLGLVQSARDEASALGSDTVAPYTDDQIRQYPIDMLGTPDQLADYTATITDAYVDDPDKTIENLERLKLDILRNRSKYQPLWGDAVWTKAKTDIQNRIDELRTEMLLK